MVNVYMFAQNIDWGYPQSMFWNKNKKHRYTPANPSFFSIIKVGSKGGHVFLVERHKF